MNVILTPQHLWTIFRHPARRWRRCHPRIWELYSGQWPHINPSLLWAKTTSWNCNRAPTQAFTYATLPQPSVHVANNFMVACMLWPSNTTNWRVHSPQIASLKEVLGVSSGLKSCGWLCHCKIHCTIYEIFFTVRQYWKHKCGYHILWNLKERVFFSINNLYWLERLK